MPRCARAAFRLPDTRAQPPWIAADPAAVSDNCRVTESTVPKAIRATRLPGRWPLNRPRFKYDAMYPDGTVAPDVDADYVLQSRRLPADAWVTRQAADEACGDGVPGTWVEYATGRRLS